MKDRTGVSRPRSPSRAVWAVAVMITFAGVPGPAGADPGSSHLAVGSGVEYDPRACSGFDLHCGAEYGDSFAIEASDKPGSYGSMWLNAVGVSLTCVAVEHTGTGHTLYASGVGADGTNYFATVTSSVAIGTFLISSSPEDQLCGAPRSYGTFGHGGFVIVAM